MTSKSARHMTKTRTSPRAAAKTEAFTIIETFVAGHIHGEWDVTKRIPQGTKLDMVFEIQNPYDRRALKLMHKGFKVGYLPRVDRAPSTVGYDKVWNAINAGVPVRVIVLQHAPQNPTYYQLKIRVEGSRPAFVSTDGPDKPVPTF